VFCFFLADQVIKVEQDTFLFLTTDSIHFAGRIPNKVSRSVSAPAATDHTAPHEATELLGTLLIMRPSPCRPLMKYGAIAIRRGHRGDGQLLGRVYSAAPHHAAKEWAKPDTKIVDVLPTMRLDTVNLVNQSIEEKRQAYVLVNNRSEGNAPLTVQTLVERPQTDPWGSPVQSRTVTVSANSWHESGSEKPG